MKYTYKPENTCSSKFEFDIEDGIVKKLVVTDGCSGNLQGIGQLVVGMKVEDVISRLKGIRCGRKATSCPDQMAIALEKFQQQ
jgi:uncharacterized protein (TIGR03905 family)